MTSKISDYKDVTYVRDYSHDTPPQQNIFKRVALAAVPFLSMDKRLRMPISLVMGSLRFWNTDSSENLQKIVTVMALAGTIFRHQFGMVISTVHDVVLEAQQIRAANTWEDASKGLVKILGSLVYLALISRGGLELSIASFAIQAAVNLINARDEFKNDRWIEGCSNLLMSGIRLQQTYGQCQQLKRNWEIEAAIKKVYVGQLHEKWRFPSDHLPVGIEVNGVRIINWNVLNNAYMEWVDNDSQGLNNSLISDLNVPVNEDGLTKRDVLVADMVQDMMSKGHIVSLQECSEPFLQHLQGRLTPDWEMIKSFPTAQEDQDVVLYNKGQLTYQAGRSETTRDAYHRTSPGRPLQNVYFSNANGSDIRVINAHIPGDPAKRCWEEFAEYVRKQSRDCITVAGGDNNFERQAMIDAYRKAGFTDFSLHSPWQTNIDPYSKESKGIDHIFVIGEESSRDLKVDEVLTGGNLKETIDLLNQPRFHTQTV